MLFNLFGKKEKDDEKRLFKDIVWMNTAAKFKALEKACQDDPSVLLVGWFPDTVKTLREAFGKAGLEETRVMEAKYVHGSHAYGKKILFIEHYPLHEKEINLVQTLQLEQALVYSAMDEPLFKHLGSDKVIPMMKMMGMKENEPIEHPLVAKSVISAQEKIAAKVTVEMSANSQGEWVLLNLKAV